MKQILLSFAVVASAFAAQAEVPAPTFGGELVHADFTYSSGSAIAHIKTVPGGKIYYTKSTTANCPDPKVTIDGDKITKEGQTKSLILLNGQGDVELNKKTTTIKAIAVLNGEVSPVATQVYTYVDNDPAVTKMTLDGQPILFNDDMEQYFYIGDAQTNPLIVNCELKEDNTLFYAPGVGAGLNLSEPHYLKADGGTMVLPVSYADGCFFYTMNAEGKKSEVAMFVYMIENDPTAAPSVLVPPTVSYNGENAYQYYFKGNPGDMMDFKITMPAGAEFYLSKPGEILPAPDDKYTTVDGLVFENVTSNIKDGTLQLAPVEGEYTCYVEVDGKRSLMAYFNILSGEKPNFEAPDAPIIRYKGKETTSILFEGDPEMEPLQFEVVMTTGAHLYVSYPQEGFDTTRATGQASDGTFPEDIELDGHVFVDLTEFLDNGVFTSQAMPGEWRFFARLNDLNSAVTTLTVKLKESGVAEIETAEGAKVIYDLNGVRVRDGKALKGIFIVNGKKVVIK